MLQDNNSNISRLLLDNSSEFPKTEAKSPKTQAKFAKTQAKSPKTQAFRQLWLFMVAEYGRKNKPDLMKQMENKRLFV